MASFVATVQNGKMPHDVESTAPSVVEITTECVNRFAIFDECPLCGCGLSAEHAHFRCTTCGWRDSCCD